MGIVNLLKTFYIPTKKLFSSEKSLMNIGLLYFYETNGALFIKIKFLYLQKLIFFCDKMFDRYFLTFLIILTMYKTKKQRSKLKRHYYNKKHQKRTKKWILKTF